RERVDAAEGRIVDLEQELEGTRKELAEMRAAAEARASHPSAAALSAAATFVTDELGTLLEAAEEAARGIVERAEAESEDELAGARHVWAELQTQLERYSAWRSRAEPVIATAQERVADLQERSRALAERFLESIRLLTDSLGAMDLGLREVMALPPPPAIAAPDEMRLPDADLQIMRDPEQVAQAT